MKRLFAEDRIVSNLQIVENAVINDVNDLTEWTQMLAPESGLCNDDARSEQTLVIQPATGEPASLVSGWLKREGSPWWGGAMRGWNMFHWVTPWR